MTADVPTCQAVMGYIEDVTGGAFEYNAQIFDYEWNEEQQVVVDFLTKSGKVNDIYAAIHVENSTKDPIFEWGSDRVDFFYRSDILLDYSWYFSYLIELNHPFITMSGEFYSKDGSITQTIWMQETLRDLPARFWS